MKIINKDEKMKAIRFFLIYPTWKGNVSFEDRREAMLKIASDLNNIPTNWSDLYGEPVKALNNIDVEELRFLFLELINNRENTLKKTNVQTEDTNQGFETTSKTCVEGATEMTTLNKRNIRANS